MEVPVRVAYNRTNRSSDVVNMRFSFNFVKVTFLHFCFFFNLCIDVNVYTVYQCQ